MLFQDRFPNVGESKKRSAQKVGLILRNIIATIVLVCNLGGGRRAGSKKATSACEQPYRVLFPHNTSLSLSLSETVLMRSFSCRPTIWGTLCLSKLWRAWCRADKADVIMAKFRPWEAHGQGQETGAAATSRAEDKPGAGDNTPNVDGDEGSAKGVSSENVAIGVEEKSAAINATKAKTKSSLFDPKDAVKTVLEGLRGAIHSAVEKSGLMDVKAPSRKLFDSPTHLLEVCEVSGCDMLLFLE